MPKFPKIVRFILTFLVVYLLLVLLAGVSGFRHHFTKSFASWASETYSDFIPNAEVSFQAVEGMGEYDLVITYMNTKTKEAKMEEARLAGLTTANLDVSSSQFSVWDYFLLQYIVLIALVAASPITWKRKGLSFLIGGIVLTAFTFHRFHCTLKYYAKISPVLEPQGLSSFEEKYINSIFNMQSIEFIFIFTFIIWALSTVRKKDIEVLR